MDSTISTKKDNFYAEIAAYNSALSASDLCERLGLEIENGNILCPLHDEDNPSAHIYDDHVFCHGCGRYIDPIHLVMAVNECGFKESIRWIAKEADLAQPSLNGDSESCYKAIAATTETYTQIFGDSLKNPEKAITCLEGRGLDAELLKGKVGHLPYSYKPKDKEASEKAGLISKKGNFLFAGRLVIPITLHGQIVSLYGRSLDDDTIPKHIYPATSAPPMPAALWNLDKCRKQESIWLCESIIDALTLVQHGYDAVGLFGTQGLTEARLALLKKSKIKKINLVFDTDTNGSGQKAVLKVGAALFRKGFHVRVITLPPDEGSKKVDVNSFFQAHSIEDFRLIEPKDFFEYALDQIPTQGRPDEKYLALQPVLSLIATQPQLTWHEYATKLQKRFPEYKATKIVREIVQLSKEDSEPASEKFYPLVHAEQIKKLFHVLFYHAAFYKYRDGAYEYWYPEELDKLIVELIGPQVQAYQLDAVKRLLKGLAFVRPENINRPDRLNLQNGILNLESGEFLDHTPEFLSTVQAQVRFEAASEWPTWKKFLDEILPHQDEQLLLSEVFGYCLTPDVSHHKAIVLVGEGANGKSVILNVLEALVGPDNCSALMLSDLKERFRLAELENKLVNIVTEVEAKSLIHDAKFKSIVTGDPQVGERKNQDPFKFRPFSKWIIACNNLPASRDRSYGYERRLIIIPFEKVIPENRRDPDLAKNLIHRELSGILNWALGGYRRLRDRGMFTIPESSKKALRAYREQIDPTLTFLDEQVIHDEAEAGVPLKRLYLRYKNWCEESGYMPVGKIIFGRTVERELKVEAQEKTFGMLMPKIKLRDPMES
jgi:putative DNA primase/helicase